MKDRTESHSFPADTLHVGKPNIGNREAFLSLINDVLDRHWLTNNGPLVQELEQRISERLGVKHCILVSSGTMALEIAISALGMTGEVIMPSFTFVSTAHALQWQGVTPVFCDIDPATHNLDPNQVEALITERTTGILGVHLWGRACAPEALSRISKQHGLSLLFDAAHAFGCSHKGRMIGTFGDAEIFSFHATKIFNTAEGGAIVTQNDELADKTRAMRNFGFSGYDNVVCLGINGKMNELCAALGLANLESLDDFIASNRRNYDLYRDHLCHLQGLSLLEYNSKNKNNWQCVVMILDESMTGVSRDTLISVLHNHNILARRYFWPGCHQMEPYRSKNDQDIFELPATERIAKQVLVLPTGQNVHISDISRTCHLIVKSLQGRRFS